MFRFIVIVAVFEDKTINIFGWYMYDPKCNNWIYTGINKYGITHSGRNCIIPSESNSFIHSETNGVVHNESGVILSETLYVVCITLTIFYINRTGFFFIMPNYIKEI